MKLKNKKIILIFLMVLILSILVYAFIHKSKTKSKQTSLNQTQNNVSQIPKKISIRYAFADIDFDKIIQDVDKIDGDDKADYIFIDFKGPIVPGKVKENSVLDIKTYKLDGKDLPEDSVVFINKELGNTELIIRLPNKYLNGKNSGHTLEIDKDVNINNVTKIEGNLKINLPYSTRSKINKNINSNNKIAKDMPKYSIELGKMIPASTTILIKLEVKDPSEYEVFVDEQKMDMRKNKEGNLVFINSIRKDFTYDDVQDRLKIVKIKK